MVFSKYLNSRSRGEISTGVAIFILITSLIGLVAGYQAVQTPTGDKAKAASCPQVQSVSFPQSLASGQDFKCTVIVESAHANSSSMTCGWSKNGGWPQNGGRWQNATCNGTTCTFDIRMDPNLDPAANYEIVGYDFRSECGPTANGSKRIAITQPASTPTGGSPICNTDSCTSCILQNRPDLLPFYQSNGWDISCNNQPAIKNNWCQISPNDCQLISTTACLSQCSSSTPTTVPSEPDPTQAPQPTNTPRPSSTPTPTPTTPPDADCGYYNLPCCPVPKVGNQSGTCVLSTLTCNNNYTCVAKSTPTITPSYTPTPTTKSQSPLKAPPIIFQNPLKYFSKPTSTPTPTPQTPGVTQSPEKDEIVQTKILVQVTNEENKPIDLITISISPGSANEIRMESAKLPLQKTYEFTFIDKLEKGKTYNFTASIVSSGETFPPVSGQVVGGDTAAVDIALSPTGLYEFSDTLSKLTQDSLNNLETAIYNIPVLGTWAGWLFSNVFDI